MVYLVICLGIYSCYFTLKGVIILFEKNKIVKVEVYTLSNRLIISTDDFSVNHSGEQGLGLIILLKGNVVLQIHKGTKVKTVTYLVSGDRNAYDSIVSVSTEFQLNVNLVEEFGYLQERRRYYKIKKDIPAEIILVTSDDENVICDEPFNMMIKDINIGGVFILTGNVSLHVNEIITIKFSLMGKELVLFARILRVQKSEDGFGYGCSFIKVKNTSEEIIAQYINMIQRQSLDEIKTKISKR